MLVFFLVTFWLFQMEVKKPSLPKLNKISEFNLIDIHDQLISWELFKNKVAIANFIFTTCSGVCPLMTQNMQKLYRSYAIEPEIIFVSISVNPEYDTPEILRQYIKNLKVDENKWYFLTGSREEIQRVASQIFKLGSVEEPVFHSTYFILIDRQGRIRGNYNGMEAEEMNRLYKDASWLIKDKNI